MASDDLVKTASKQPKQLKVHNDLMLLYFAFDALIFVCCFTAEKGEEFEPRCFRDKDG